MLKAASINFYLIKNDTKRSLSFLLVVYPNLAKCHVMVMALRPKTAKQEKS